MVGKKGKGAFKKAFKKLPEGMKRVLTVGGTLAIDDVIDWLFGIIA